MKERKIIIGIYLTYGILFALFVFKMFFYANEIGKKPDEKAHLSYVVYMEKNPDMLIPKFEDIKICKWKEVLYEGGNKILKFQEGNVTCYLGHPPFYYKLLQICDVVDIDGDNIYVNMTKISDINILLTSVTMLLILYTGFRYFLKNRAGWTIHLTFAAICTCLPLYGYVGSGINNDNLCNLGLVIFWIGLLRYFEREKCLSTYVLIGLGVLISCFSKLTTGIIVVLVCLVVVLFDILKNKNCKIICNSYFVMTLPIYAIIAIYFIRIYCLYGAFQPSYPNLVSMEEYRASAFYVEEAARTSLTFGEYAKHFFTGLLRTWTSTYHNSYTIDRTGLLLLPFIATLILFLIQADIVLMKYLKRKELSVETISAAFGAAIIVTILLHFWRQWNVYLSEGYLGGYQARYYMPCIPVIAFGTCQFCYDNEENGNTVKKRAIDVTLLILSALMIYADFFYYVWSYYRL